MTSKERVRTALEHKEPDQIPYDLGSTIMTGMHMKAYQALLKLLETKKDEFPLVRELAGAARIDEDVLKRLHVDTRGVFPMEFPSVKSEDDSYEYLFDEWGKRLRRPKDQDLYYDLDTSPFGSEFSVDAIQSHHWPDFSNVELQTRYQKEITRQKQKGDYALVLENVVGSQMFDSCFALRGHENFYMDLALEPDTVAYLMDKLLELQMQFWEPILESLKGEFFIVRLGDDLGSQTATRVSQDMYRTLIKPRHRKIIEFIKKNGGENAYVFFHSDGAIYNLIPDLIEIGVDILNPLQFTLPDLGAEKVKKEFGNELTFWGAGIDTQKTLPHGKKQEIQDEVKHQIETLAPGGGFVFTQIHNVQKDVAPESFMTMWDTFQKNCRY